MIRLNQTATQLLSLITAQNGANVVVSYSDKTTTSYSGNTQVTNIVTATTTTICDTPAASTIRDIDHISIKNTFAGSHTITVQVSSGGTLYPIFKTALLTDEVAEYTHGSGWKCYDASGNIKNTPLTAMTSAQLAAILSDETGTGSAVFATSPQFTSGIGIGGAAITQAAIYISPSLTLPASGNQTYGFLSDPTSDSNTTTRAAAAVARARTAAAAFTCTNAIGFYSLGNSAGAGSTITNSYGNYAAHQSGGGTLNVGFCSEQSTATGAFGFLHTGNANNAFAGNTRFGAITAPVATVDITGSLAATTSILSSGATSGIGYTTGAGGTVTQATSRTTGVTINKVTGAITLVSAAGSTTPSTFTVTNSAIAATDNVIVQQKSGTDLYNIHVTAIAAGSFNITSWTTGGTTTEQPVFNFSIIKGVTA